jgi:hypothetical protein
VKAITFVLLLILAFLAALYNYPKPINICWPSVPKQYSMPLKRTASIATIDKKSPQTRSAPACGE